jgi:hypothetical protein
MPGVLLFVALVALSVISHVCGSANTTKEAAFRTWFTVNGGVMHAMELAQFPRMGRGFAATGPIKENDKLLQIPHKLIFSTKNMARNLDDRTRKVLETLGTDAALYAWLLLEKNNPQSFFKPYIDVLPQYVSSLVYFDEEELNELHSAQLKEESQDMQVSAKADYNAFLAAYSQIMKQRGAQVTPDTTIPYGEYLWAMSMFNSRGLRFQGPVYMAPMADIFNYQPHPTPRSANNGDFFAKHHKLDADGLTVYADRAHAVAESDAQALTAQVYEDYGDNSDEIYFKYHGFVPDENPFRCAVLGLDGVVGDMVLNTPAGSAGDNLQTPESSKGLLPGATAAHRAMFDALEFNRLPSKCVDAVAPVTGRPTATQAGGYFGKGLEVLLILLSFTEAEAAHCSEYVQATTTRPSSGNKAGAKNWPGIFKECGFSAAEEFLRNVRAHGAEAAISTASQADALKIELNRRVLGTVQSFLELNIERDAMSTGIHEDAAHLQTLQAQLDANFSVPLLHRYLAVKYRLHRKELLLTLAKQYGSTAAVQRLQGKLLADPAVAPWDALGATDSTASLSVDGLAAADAIASAAELVTRLPADATLSDKVQAFNAWFTSLNPIPCHISAMEIPEFRLGTITTRNIRKGEVYLGISTQHGGIMDSDIALKGDRNPALAKLLNQLIATYPKRDDFHELMFFLLHEMFVMRERSFYWPYLSLLPTYADMESNAFVPLLWAEEDIKTRLGPSDVTGVISDYHAKTRSRFNALVKMKQIQEFFPNSSAGTGVVNTAEDKVYDVFTFRNYQWATVILDSRSIWWNGKRHLVPMLDFINCQEHVQDRAQLHSTVLDETGQYAITRAGRKPRLSCYSGVV